MQTNIHLCYIFIKEKNYRVRVNLKDILYLQSRNQYVDVVTKTKTYIIRTSLNKLQEGLFPHVFCRVHLSYIINMEHINITYSDYFSLLEDDRTVPFHKNYTGSFDAKVITLN